MWVTVLCLVLSCFNNHVLLSKAKWTQWISLSNKLHSPSKKLVLVSFCSSLLTSWMSCWSKVYSLLYIVSAQYCPLLPSVRSCYGLMDFCMLPWLQLSKSLFRQSNIFVFPENSSSFHWELKGQNQQFKPRAANCVHNTHGRHLGAHPFPSD